MLIEDPREHSQFIQSIFLAYSKRMRPEDSLTLAPNVQSTRCNGNYVTYTMTCYVRKRVILCCKYEDNMLYTFRALGKCVLPLSSKYFCFPFCQLKT